MGISLVNGGNRTLNLIFTLLRITVILRSLMRIAGLEPTKMILKITILPLNYTPHIFLSSRGFEPLLEWLTATCSTVKLRGFFLDWKGFEPLTFYV